MICRKVTFRFPMPLVPLLEHKNGDFVLEKPENEGFKPQKRTKTSILCSKCPKTRVPNPKSAQKPRFCARNARKQGFQTPKAHKNLDFVLEMPENEGSKPQKRTKTPILCSGRLTGGLGCSSRPTQRASGSGEVAAGHQKEASGRRKRAASHQN